MERVLIFQVLSAMFLQTELFRASKSLQDLYDNINCNYCAVFAWNDLASIILVKTGEKGKRHLYSQFDNPQLIS